MILPMRSNEFICVNTPFHVTNLAASVNTLQKSPSSRIPEFEGFISCPTTSAQQILLMR